MSKQLNLTFALKDGITVHISEVESGLKCDCKCPACGEPLVAKKGKVTMHHFAHHAGHNCEYGYETSLHLAAKEILCHADKMQLPPVYITFPNSNKEDILLSPSKEVSIDKVELEKKYSDIIPDVVVYSGNKKFFVEIYVTHRTDENKLNKLKKLNISTIEIDLSQKETSISKDELKEKLIGYCENKTWKHNVLAEKWLKKFYQVSEEKEIIQRGFTLHVDNCPMNNRIWRGKSYANYLYDCSVCPFCISLSANENAILCSGKCGIESLDDFSLSEEQRRKKCNQEKEDRKKYCLENKICFNCGAKLVERNSKYGVFWGCSQYPHCKFMITVDHKTGELIMKS